MSSQITPIDPVRIDRRHGRICHCRAGHNNPKWQAIYPGLCLCPPKWLTTDDHNGACHCTFDVCAGHDDKNDTYHPLHCCCVVGSCLVCWSKVASIAYLLGVV